MASNTTTLAQSVLQHQDVSFLSHAGVIVAAKLTKHNQSRRPLHIHILTQADSVYFPVQYLINFFQPSWFPFGPLFIFPDGSSVSISFSTLLFNQWLVFCTLDPRHHKLHSFCIGATSYAAGQGFTDSQIRSLGRWKSALTTT